MLNNRVVLLLTVMLCLAGCTSLAEEFARKASMLNMKREVMTGLPFQHVVYFKKGYSSKTLHIYLDGDGTPWIVGRPSDDPTPRNPLLLKLMALDPAPAAYVGRPCYHGLKSIGDCSSHYWLKDRYSEEVVTSLKVVVKRLLELGNYEQIAWFGHSGGGTLAVLLASRFPQTTSVVTVAANLDIDAWAAYVGHIDLSGSLNPASLPPLSPAVLQRHYAGAKDEIVPPSLMAGAPAHLGSKLIVLEDYDHVCCWERVWTNILGELTQ